MAGAGLRVDVVEDEVRIEILRGAAPCVDLPRRSQPEGAPLGGGEMARERRGGLVGIALASAP